MFSFAPGRPSMQFNRFMHCTVGRRAELGSGMAGKDPRLCRRMLDEIPESTATMDNMLGGPIRTRRAVRRAPGHLTCNHTEG